MKTPHKRAELIKAWADGAEIEWKYPANAEWENCERPAWLEQVEYRIKPEPKPDVVGYTTIDSFYCSSHLAQHNLKLIFDGETGELKSAEVIS